MPDIGCPPVSAGASAACGMLTRVELTPYAEEVLEAVEAIPAGKVMSYGDVAEWVGRGGPRQVGRVLAVWGSGVPWWRCLHADGTPPPGHEAEALRRLRRDGTPLRPSGDRVDMRLARWDGGAG